MKALQAKPRKRKLTVEALEVDAFPTTPEVDEAELAATVITNCGSRCPTHFDSQCPCCTGEFLCPP
jgi:hypothetical protein